jgi:hypothetical protein
MLPTDAHVVGFPETAAGGSHVIGLRIANHAGSGHRTPAAKRTNRAPLQRFENGVVIVSGRGGLRGCVADAEAENEKWKQHAFYHAADNTKNLTTKAPGHKVKF